MRTFRDYLKGFQAFNNSEGYIQTMFSLPKTAPTSWCVLHIDPSGQNFNSVCISQDLCHFSTLMLSMLFTKSTHEDFLQFSYNKGRLWWSWYKTSGWAPKQLQEIVLTDLNWVFFRALLLVLVHLWRTEKLGHLQEASTESKRQGCLKFMLLFSQAIPSAKLHLHHPKGSWSQTQILTPPFPFIWCSSFFLSEPSSPFQFPHGTSFSASHLTFCQISFCPHSPLPPQAPTNHHRGQIFTNLCLFWPKASIRLNKT